MEQVAAIFKIGNSKDFPEIPDHLSNDAKNFIKLCLQREPSARPTASQLLEQPFVKNQSTAKVAHVGVTKEAYPRSFDGSRTPVKILIFFICLKAVNSFFLLWQNYNEFSLANYNYALNQLEEHWVRNLCKLWGRNLKRTRDREEVRCKLCFVREMWHFLPLVYLLKPTILIKNHRIWLVILYPTQCW